MTRGYLDTGQLLRDLNETRSYRELVRKGYDPQLLDIQLQQLGYRVETINGEAEVVRDDK